MRYGLSREEVEDYQGETVSTCPRCRHQVIDEACDYCGNGEDQDD